MEGRVLARKVTRQPQKRDSAKCVGLVPSEAVAKAKAAAVEAAKPKKPGLISRLLAKAEKPL